MIDALLNICNKIWQTGEWPTTWTPSLVITLPKKGNLQQCSKYRTISLNSYASKVMLKILLNRLKPQAEKIIAEEQAGFTPGRSTHKHIIFNLRILCERYLQHQQDLFHVFVHFKKSFYRVWHASLWSTLKLYNINTNLIFIIESLYSKANNAVYYNGSVGEWFRTTIEVRQGCLLSPTLFNLYLERIMTESVSVGGTTIANLQFADDIDALAGKEEELIKLVNKLNKASKTYDIEVSAEKTKLMINNNRRISSDIGIGNQNLEAIQSYGKFCPGLPKHLVHCENSRPYGKGKNSKIRMMHSIGHFNLPVHERDLDP